MVVLYSVFFLFSNTLLIQGSLCLTLGVGQCYVLASDSSSSTFAVTLFLISVSVLIWSFYYIDSEPEFRTFVSLLLCFLVSIFILVFSADLLRLFVAWDLLGFTSFFLVVYYRTRVSLAGGLLTGLSNRVGDVLLLIIFGYSPFRSCGVLSSPILILLWVSFTKSAQVPFSRWLPSAMTAPTPVSALVHSSTLVTAGVFLLYRLIPCSSVILSAVGIFTMLIAGTSACLECDIKKIIALSTLSHLGLIITTLGLFSRSYTFSHLVIHAAFKALLFLAVGTAIHGCYGSQESRSMESLARRSALVMLVLIIALSSNVGLVFSSGYVSKEALLLKIFNNGLGFIFVVLFYFGIGLTLFYSLRLLTCLASSHFRTLQSCGSGSVPLVVKVPLLLLALLTIIQGCRSVLVPPSSTGLVCLVDQILVFGVFVIICCLYLLKSPAPFIYSLPSSQLLIRTSGLSRCFVTLDLVQGTEVAILQGFGLGCARTLVSQASMSAPVLGKVLVLITFVFFIV